MAKPRFSLNGDKGDKQDVAHTLQLKFDELNELWSRAEAQLRRIPIPHDVLMCAEEENCFDDGPAALEDFKIRYCLGFVNLRGTWRIGYVSEDDSSPDPRDDIPWRPISDCSAEIRVKMVKHLDKLREAVLEEAGKYVGTLESAISTFSATLDAWGD